MSANPITVELKDNLEYLNVLLVQSQGEVTEEIQNLMNTIDEDTAKLTSFYFKIYTSLSLKEEYYKNKKAKVDNKIKSIQTSMKFFSDSIDSCMKKLGRKDLVTNLGKISYRKSHPLYVDENQINEIDPKYKRAEVKVTGIGSQELKDFYNDHKEKINISLNESVDKTSLKNAIKTKTYTISDEIARIENIDNIQLNINHV